MLLQVNCSQGPSIHYHPLIRGRVAGAAAWAGTPRLPSPRTLPALPGGSQDVPRPAGRHRFTGFYLQIYDLILSWIRASPSSLSHTDTLRTSSLKQQKIWLRYDQNKTDRASDPSWRRVRLHQFWHIVFGELAAGLIVNCMYSYRRRSALSVLSELLVHWVGLQEEKRGLVCINISWFHKH